MPDDANIAKKNFFYQEWTEVIERIADRRKLIILEDLNAPTGARNNDSIVGQDGENVRNNKGVTLIELFQQQALKITNGWFIHKNIHRYTWTQPTRFLIDYVIVRQQSKLTIQDV